MKLNNYNIQIGHIARHSPSKIGSQENEAALIDIAQDLLFIYLDSINMFNNYESIQGNKAHEPSKFNPEYGLRNRKENASRPGRYRCFIGSCMYE